jgi:hypothetical protein
MPEDKIQSDDLEQIFIKAQSQVKQVPSNKQKVKDGLYRGVKPKDKDCIAAKELLCDQLKEAEKVRLLTSLIEQNPRCLDYTHMFNSMYGSHDG